MRSAAAAALIPVAVGVLLASCGGMSAEEAALARATAAMGGAERFARVRMLRAEGTGTLHAQGESNAPGAALPSRPIREHLFLVDFSNGRWRVEQTRERNTALGVLRERHVEGLDGHVAYELGGSGTGIHSAEYEEANRRAMLLHHPIGAIRATLAEGSLLSNLWRGGNRVVVDVSTADDLAFTLYLDASTFLPSRVRSLVYHPNLGDVALETDFSAYVDVDGLLLPSLVTRRLDGDVVLELRLDRQELTGDPETLAAPEEILRARASIASEIGVIEVAPGLWRLTGDTVESFVIEFERYLVLVEAPGSSARTLALIDQARRLRAGKPLRYLINTHHHFAHSGGIRAAVSEGLTIVTHERNQPFYEDMVRRPHTLFPDPLTSKPGTLLVEPVSERFVLEDPRQRVEIHPVGSDPHASTMLMVYLPRERMLIRPGGMPGTSFDGGPEAPVNRQRLARAVDALGLEVDYLLPLRGQPIAMDEIRRSGASATANRSGEPASRGGGGEPDDGSREGLEGGSRGSGSGGELDGWKVSGSDAEQVAGTGPSAR